MLALTTTRRRPPRSHSQQTIKPSSSTRPGGSARRRRRDHKQRRGKHRGLRAKLMLTPHRLSLPSIFLANVRSLVNKMDEIRLRITHSKRLLDCNVMVFTETWLHSDIPNNVIDLTGRYTLQADRTADDSGKTRGGGLCIYVNKAWCTNSDIVGRHCSPNSFSLLNVDLFICRWSSLPPL